MSALRAFAWCVALQFGALALPAAAQAPRVDSIAPAQGPVRGGTAVTITGAGFSPDTAVRFNRNPAASVRVVDPTRLEVTTPSMGDGAFATALATVRVANAAGMAFAEFLYVPPRFDEIGIGDITTIAGVGHFVGDGRPAAQALVEAQSIAIDAAGNIYLGEEAGGRVRKIGADGRIVTIAGTGSIGYSGDGGPATDAQFNWPAGVAVDRAGNVYVSDFWDNYRVRRIDAQSGIVRTIAGNGTRGSSGDGGPATQAQVDHPTTVVLDAAGNVFFVDSRNQRVRRIDTAGTITTVAGNGLTGFAGDGGPATQASFRFVDGHQGVLAVDSRGVLYVDDFGNSRIRRIGSDGVIRTVVGGGTRPASGGAVATEVNTVVDGIAIDGQDRVLLSTGTRVWRVEADGTLALVAGNGVTGISPDGVRAVDAPFLPENLAVAPNGDILVSERNATRIRRIDSRTGLLSTVAGIGPAAVGDGGSPAIAAAFVDWGTIALDAAAGIFVVEQRGQRIRRIDSAGRVSTVAGSGVAPKGTLDGEGVSALQAAMSPTSVQAHPDGTLYFTEFCSVRRTGADGIVRTTVGPLGVSSRCGFGGDGGPGTSAQIAAEQGTLKLDSRGNVFIADVFNHRIRRWDRSTGIVTTFAGSGPASEPGGYDPNTSNFAAFAGDAGPADRALLGAPTDVAFDSRGNACIADVGNGSVRCVDGQGVIRTVAGRGSNYPGDGGPATAAILHPYRLAFDRADNLYIADTDGSIRKVTPAGILSTVAGVPGQSGFSGDGGPALQARLDTPYGLAVDANGNILVFDGSNRRIRVIKQAAAFGNALPANTPGPLSGLWWNANESGWGINFTQRNNIVFSAWYTYDAAGNPKWYVAPRCVLPSSSPGGSCSETLYEVNGPAFFGAAFDPVAVRATPVGNLQLAFTSAGAGSMSYSVGALARTVPIARQVFGGAVAGPVDYTDLWWNPAESGWGMAITHQGSVMFLAWYVYDAAGRPVWYVASNCAVNASQDGCSGALFRTTGPPLGPTFDPTRVQAFGAGNVTLTFTDPNNATLSYSVNGVSGSKSMTRQLF